MTAGRPEVAEFERLATTLQSQLGTAWRDASRGAWLEVHQALAAARMLAARILGLATLDRLTLAVDGERDELWHSGECITLRRRRTIKRLLYMFAAEPGRAFTKEQIVKRVWDVTEYHPFRHDPILFSNMLRLRELLRDQDRDWIRVVDDGYRFHPPDDFVFLPPPVTSSIERARVVASALGVDVSGTEDEIRQRLADAVTHDIGR